MKETLWCFSHQMKICNPAGILLERVPRITKALSAHSQNGIGWAQRTFPSIYPVSRQWRQKGGIIGCANSEGDAFAPFTCTNGTPPSLHWILLYMQGGRSCLPLATHSFALWNVSLEASLESLTVVSLFQHWRTVYSLKAEHDLLIVC